MGQCKATYEMIEADGDRGTLYCMRDEGHEGPHTDTHGVWPLTEAREGEPMPCCGEYETCTRACTPRGEQLAYRKAGGARVVGMHRCPRCMGSGGPALAVAFINTGEDYTKHEQRLVDGRCEACGGTGKVDGDTLERLALAEGQRRARVAMKMSLAEAAAKRGISSAELSAIEHARAASSSNGHVQRKPKA